MSTAHVTPNPELRAEVERMLERMALVQQVRDLTSRGCHAEVCGLLGIYPITHLTSVPELGVEWAWALYRTEAWERQKLLALVQQIVAAAREHPHTRAYYGCRNLEAVLLYHLGDCKTAEEIWKEDVIACVADNRLSEEMAAWSNLGIVASIQGRGEEALAFFHRALMIAEQVGAHSLQVTTYNNVGMAYLALNRPYEAEKAVSTAIRKLTELGTWEEARPMLMITLGQALLSQDDLAAARAIATCAARMEMAAIIKAELARLLGAISLREGMLDEAHDHLSFALQEAQRLGERLLVAETLEASGELADMRGQLYQAREHYLAAERVYLELPSEWRAARARARADALAE